MSQAVDGGGDAVEEAAAEIERTIGGPDTLTIPEDFEMTGSWERAQRAPSSVSPIGPAEWMVEMGYQQQRHEPLTDAEADVIEACEHGAYGVREYARETDRSPGTIGNLLRRARDKFHDRDRSFHRVTFALKDGEVIAECPCDGFRYRGWCAHVAVLWWRWAGRCNLSVTDLDTRHKYCSPPWWMNVEWEGSRA
jgi:DNA-binding CsgD family transcriptional regulator